jgi:outer membrane protein OmpA-like peptidoglycan-associated protein
MTSEQLLREFVKQYFRLTKEEDINRILPAWQFVGDPLFATEQDRKRGHMTIRVVGPFLKEFAAKSKEEQQAINSEADQRFWDETGYKRGKLLGTSPEDKKMGRRWMAARAEVQSEHDKVDAIHNLSPEIQAILFAGDKDSASLKPEDYDKLLALAVRLQELTPGELRDYKSTVTGTTHSVSCL